LITPLVVHRQPVRQETPVMIGLSFLLFAFAFDGRISRLDGAVFAALMVGYTVFLYRQGKRQAEPATASTAKSKAPRGWFVYVLLVLAGLGLLVLGANWFVEGATRIARIFGLSDLVIGLTVVALGTSAPEIATSIIAALRGERDIAVGNVIGSSIFNIVCVLGIAAIVAPDGLAVSRAMLSFDLPVMTAVAVACLPIFFTGQVIARWEGALFVGYYIAYTTYLLLYAQEHALLDNYALAMRWIVLPLTTVTIVIIALREWRRRRAGAARSE
jgi:cation:H+ antiporter